MQGKKQLDSSRTKNRVYRTGCSWMGGYLGNWAAGSSSGHVAETDGCLPRRSLGLWVKEGV